MCVYIRVFDTHNHNIKCPTSLKYPSVSNDVKDKFLCFFNHGYTSARAWRRHIKDLEEEHREKYHLISADRCHHPNLKWVRTLHINIFKKEFGMQYGPQMMENLTKRII